MNSKSIRVLVDLILPGYRSIDLISQVSNTNEEIRLLALSLVRSAILSKRFDKM